MIATLIIVISAITSTSHINFDNDLFYTFQEPVKSKSSPSRGAGVNAQYALHAWDSQEDSHNPSFPSGLPFITADLNRLRFYIAFPFSTFFHEAPHDWPREYRVKGSVLSQRVPNDTKLLAQMVRCWLDFLKVVG
ncbi:putative sucrose transporter [Erysiphe necator]|uniref:Putative sucrose transporter n=1 Tax=Uncinula necator TaxID=52586 RepID=A0A0B1P853_UNCNE|nr:putative sucrose transporter [Erysiphe necator]